MSYRLQEAIKAIKTGDTETGRKLLIQVVKSDPQNEIAWLRLSSIANSAQDCQECLERVVALNPNNQRAQKALAQLRRKQERRTKPMMQPRALVESKPVKSPSKLGQVMDIVSKPYVRFMGWLGVIPPLKCEQLRTHRDTVNDAAIKKSLTGTKDAIGCLFGIVYLIGIFIAFEPMMNFTRGLVTFLLDLNHTPWIPFTVAMCGLISLFILALAVRILTTQSKRMEVNAKLSLGSIVIMTVMLIIFNIFDTHQSFIDWYNWRQLRQFGVEIEGEVIGRGIVTIKAGQKYYGTYRFHPPAPHNFPNGFTARRQVSEDSYRSLKRGSPVMVVYNSTNPIISDIKGNDNLIDQTGRTLFNNASMLLMIPILPPMIVFYRQLAVWEKKVKKLLRQARF